MIGQRIRGEGSPRAQVMIIGEHPSKSDAFVGRPFMGRRRRPNELDRFLNGVELPQRAECYLTYWIKEWAGDDGVYLAADYERDLPLLEREINRVNPSVIVALGREVTRYFLGDVDLESVYAIPWTTERAVVFPNYNPAAGFRSPEISAQVTYGFSQLAATLNGDIMPRLLFDDPYPEPVYEEITNADTLNVVMADAETISADTEGWAWRPWSLQLCVKPGHAYVLRYANRELISLWRGWVNARRDDIRWIFHSALHDLSVFRALGVDTIELRFEDTAIAAYNLQLEPAGLKPLCARWCGMAMEHYEDVMGDAGVQLARDWLLMVWENEEDDHAKRCQLEFDRLTTTPYVDARGTLKPGRRLKVVPKLPKVDLHKAVERCLRSLKPRKLWTDQVIDRHVEAQPVYGEMWEASLDHVPLNRALAYAGRDADGTHRLYPALVERLHANDLWDVYQADLHTVPLIDRMQQIGIRPDLAHFAALSADLGIELVGIRARLADRLLGQGIDRETADALNPNSTDHVGALLFDRFGVASLKKTPGGDPSTNDRVLEALEKDIHLPGYVRDIVADIRGYREIYKLKHTFVDQVPDHVNRWPHDKRIHATFRITRVVTGRLAASNPNLLALPKHGKFAKRFRRGFVAGEGHLIASWDLSQIELRVLAHLSQDPILLAAFRTGIDLHAQLAQRIFGGAEADHKEGTTRLAAKAVNFGIPMGMTHIGLCLELRKNGVDVNEDDAQRWLTDTMKLYAEVPVYQQGKVAEGRRFGFVKDIRGRRRYIGGLHSFDEMVKSEAERFAFATPIQASATEIMKDAEAYLYTHILIPHWKRGHWVEPLIQIHDDLLLECEESIVQDLDVEMRHALTQVPAHWLSVPIETSGDCGPSWGEQHPIRAKVA